MATTLHFTGGSTYERLFLVQLLDSDICIQDGQGLVYVTGMVPIS